MNYPIRRMNEYVSMNPSSNESKHIHDYIVALKN